MKLLKLITKQLDFSDDFSVHKCIEGGVFVARCEYPMIP